MSMFHGLSAFPLTPLTPTGEIDAPMLRRFLEVIVAARPDSIGLLGSTGGFAYLKTAQRHSVLKIAVEVVCGRVPLVVGVGALRTDEAERLAQDAKAAGADGLLLAPVSYLPLTDEEVFRHFAAVAQAGQLPLCIYNNPTTTRFNFGDDLIGRLAELPHVAAIKMPLPSEGILTASLARLRASTKASIAIGYSGDWGCAEALIAGADTWYSVVAGLLPIPAVALTRAVQMGNAAVARRIDGGFQRLWGLFKAYGSFRVMHTLAKTLGFGTLEPPMPILPLPDAIEAEIFAALSDLDAVGEGSWRQSHAR